jgi:hypothetical protein
MTDKIALDMSLSLVPKCPYIYLNRRPCKSGLFKSIARGYVRRLAIRQEFLCSHHSAWIPGLVSRGPRSAQRHRPSHTHDTLYRQFGLCVLRNGTALPRSQFLHSCVCERVTYSQDRSAYLAASKYAGRSWEYINRSQIHECGNWETEHYNSVLEITRTRSFISGNASIGTRHLYWILTFSSLTV